jgi:Bacterial archaeo-eukaryotic release factor family 7
MAQLNLEELKKLSQIEADPAISIYTTAHRAGKDTRENPIRFKNQLTEVSEQLAAQGYKSNELSELLGPLETLLGDYPFWQNQRNGLAVFMGNGEVHTYTLPIAVEDNAEVSKRFYLKPLIPLLTDDGRFYILAVSLNRVRLFESTRFETSEVALEDTPHSLAEALKYDDPERSLQSVSTSNAQNSLGRGDAAFYGTGAGEDDRKTNILRFFQMLDNGVKDLLAGSETPIVFAGVDYLFPIYQEANHYRHLLPEAITGNPDSLNTDELREAAWKIIEPHVMKRKEDVLERYKSAHDKTSGNLVDVVRSAVDGRIDTLFVVEGEQVFGHYDMQDRRVDRHDEERADNEDLLDFAVTQTLQNGGRVYLVNREELPERDTPIAALYRF